MKHKILSLWNWILENASDIGYLLLKVLLLVVIVPGILALVFTPESRTSFASAMSAFLVGPFLIYIILKTVHDLYFELSTFWQVLIPSLFVYFFGYVFGSVHEDRENTRRYGPGWRATVFLSNYVRSQEAEISDGDLKSSESDDELDPVDIDLDREIDIQYADMDELLLLQKEYRIVASEGEKNLRSVNEEILNRQKQENWYVLNDND